MILDTFFEKFDQLAEAPGGVAKMRQLILDFAIGGRLLRRSDNGCLQSNGEWPRQTLGSIASLITKGSTPTSYGHQYQASGIPFVKVENIRNGGINHSSIEQFISEGTHEFLNRSQLKPGDILFSIAGTIGKTCVVHAEDVPANTNQALAIIRGFSVAFEIPFLKMQLDSFVAIKVKAKARGGAMPNVSLGDLRDLLVVLPPLAEQKQIIAKVDELMALCDRLEAQQKERETRHSTLARASLARFADEPTPANLQFLFHKSYDIKPADLRKSILTLAVRGKLVPQDPNDEPAEQVLARISATKLRFQKTGEIGKEKPVEPLQPDRLPFEAPDSWRWAKLVELTELITKGSSPKWQGFAYVSESEGILFITSENVGNYVLRKLDDLKYVSKGFNEIEPRSILKRGDILMNLVGASIGRTAIYDLHDGANINQAVALIRLVRETDGLCPRFLLHYLNSPAAIDYMLSSRVVNAQPNISLTDAREFAVPVPPLTEQRRIVVKVEQLMALVDELEAQLAVSRGAGEELLAGIVAELTA